MRWDIDMIWWYDMSHMSWHLRYDMRYRDISFQWQYMIRCFRFIWYEQWFDSYDRMNMIQYDLFMIIDLIWLDMTNDIDRWFRWFDDYEFMVIVMSAWIYHDLSGEIFVTRWHLWAFPWISAHPPWRSIRRSRPLSRETSEPTASCPQWAECRDTECWKVK